MGWFMVWIWCCLFFFTSNSIIGYNVYQFGKFASYLEVRTKMGWFIKRLESLNKKHGNVTIDQGSDKDNKEQQHLDWCHSFYHPHNIPLQYVIPLGISDHSMIGCVRKTNLLKFKLPTIKCRNYSKYDKETFNNDLKSVSFDTVFSCSNVNNARSNFKSIFSDICGKHPH